MLFAQRNILSNTPRQMAIYEALGWDIPTFGHISLILGKDYKKMSKRHGATSVEQYKQLGYLPEALVKLLSTSWMGSRRRTRVLYTR